MKKSFLFLIGFLLSVSLYAQLPTVNIYLNDGTVRHYNIDDIENIGIIPASGKGLIRVYYQDSLMENYQTKSIESIKFEKDNDNNRMLGIYISGTPHSFKMTEIDSINFFTPATPIPIITGIKPSAGRTGDEVTITGSDFGSTQASGFVSFKGANAAVYASWSDTEIKVSVPKGAASGGVTVTANDVKSNEMQFNIISTITSLNPTKGKTGDIVTIKGLSFGSSQGTSLVVFNTANATDYTLWSDSIIKVKVPSAATTGNVAVITAGNKSNEVLFTVEKQEITLVLDSVRAASARKGDTVTLSGKKFGIKQDSGFVSFNSSKAKDYILWSDTLIRVKVPADAKSGKISVTVNKQKSNELNFSIIPVMTKLYPDSAGITQNISIYGDGFGDKKESSLVYFNDIPAVDYNYWRDNEISVVVPSGAKSGTVTVKTADNTSNALPFTIKVYIVAILPANAKIGDQVSIIGSNLGNTQGNSIVSFNKANASDYQSWSDTLIKLTVPAGTNSGKLFVTVGSVRSNELSFTVIPYLSSINPTAEKIGNTVTFTGTGFNDAKGSSFVSFTGAGVSEYQSWSNSQIVVKVPSGARSGKVSVTSSGTKSNELDFSILPSITNIYPASGFVGDLVRISGISFGESRGSSTVSFNGADVTDYVSWSDTDISVLVPNGAMTGKVYVTVGSNKTNEMNFTLTPRITSVSPDNSEIGAQVTITGINFGPTQGTSLVSFKGADATSYPVWSNTSITVTVPGNAVTGKISVTVGGIKSNEVDFTVTSIVIGTQEWMTKNLDVKTYRNGDQIPQVTDQTEWDNLTTGAWCYYSNNSSNEATYGILYNWYAVNDSRGLAPTGWHVATDAEWSTLTTYLGGESVAGGKLKETGTTHWTSPNTGASNESGFTALPGGYRYNGFARMGDAASFWTSTQNDASSAWNRSAIYNNATVGRAANPKNIGFSVRCVKD